MPGFHIHIRGQVQGVGFRPFVYVAAQAFGVLGWVNNTIDGVHVRFTAKESIAMQFYRHLIQKAPAMSIITDHEMSVVESEAFDDFRIIRSDESGLASLLLTPDFAMCPVCREELRDSTNRRKAYPFITCTNCGPRYSIITALPYDRPYTTMNPFHMCAPCQAEYDNPLDRRYYSQTNSCGSCPVHLEIYHRGDLQADLSDPGMQLDYIVEKLKAGAILAIKGIGGFLLICDAANATAIRTLRKRKSRPAKAFAMMFSDVDAIENELVLTPGARDLLESPVAPIVLLPRKPVKSSYCMDLIAPGLDRIGVMLPYTPLYQLILDHFGRAILATSGNVSDAPIVYQNQQALQSLSSLADVIVVNDRDIVAPQDDSVVLFSSGRHQKILLRRSRGLAPGYLNDRQEMPANTLLAVGAELKSSFTLLFNHITYISQYLGDLEDYATQLAFEHTLDHFLRLFDAKPKIILHDMHPGYYSTQLAGKLGDRFGIKTIAVQHHEAHLAAILGEHRLFSEEEPVLGIIWDGTGYGTDGQIWGGEVFKYTGGQIARTAQIEYFDFLFGDKMPKEPRISLLSVGRQDPAIDRRLQQKFSQAEWKIYQRLLIEQSRLQTSSMGRLFDAMASLLLGTDRMSYEGEAAMYLEVAARKYRHEHGTDRKFQVPESCWKNLNLDAHRLVQWICQQLDEGQPADKLAFEFHMTLVAWIRRIALRSDCKKLAFSGGVFQNSLLVDLIIETLETDFTLYFHEKLSPNDECISFGQLMHHLHVNPSEKGQD